MSECKTDTHCNTTSTSVHKKQEGGCDVIRYMETLANKAWEELFKEKVKTHYEASIGQKMNEQAKIVAERAISEWQCKMEIRENKKKYEQELFGSMKDK